MPTHKKFLMYAIWVILFFIFSQVMIYVALNTAYSYKKVVGQSSLIREAEIKTSSISGIAKIKLFNNTQTDIENKYIKIDCYSKHNVLMGTKYIEIEELKANEEQEYEVRFNFNKVDNAVIDVVDEIPSNITKEQLLSDKKLTFVAVVAALIAIAVI